MEKKKLVYEQLKETLSYEKLPKMELGMYNILPKQGFNKTLCNVYGTKYGSVWIIHSFYH